jgi:hypothetical protein
MLYAIIDSEGLVVNAIRWDRSTEWQPPAGCSIVPLENGGLGWSYVNGEFVPPVAPIEEAPESTVIEALAAAAATEALALPEEAPEPVEALLPSIEE